MKLLWACGGRNPIRRILVPVANHATDVILIETLVYSSQINVIAVFGASISLRNLVIQGGSKVARHKAIHGKMINR